MICLVKHFTSFSDLDRSLLNLFLVFAKSSTSNVFLTAGIAVARVLMHAFLAVVACSEVTLQTNVCSVWVTNV